VTPNKAAPPRTSWLAALGRWLAWSNLRRFPRELLAGALLVAANVALVAGSRHLGTLAAVLLWAAWCAAAVLYLWRTAARVFGPVLFYDLLRTTRGGQCFSLRSLYGFLLLVILLLLYLSWFGGGRRGPMRALTGTTMAVREVPRFATHFFVAFLGVQYGLVLLLTPVTAASALAEEKERRTLEFVLASELLDREILLGKLASRLVHLSQFLLVGLPVLGLLQFLGGVDPNLVLAGYLATFATMLSVACLSLLNSAYVSRVRGAVFLTYAEAAGYLLVSLLCCWPFSQVGGSWNPVNWVAIGNPVVAWLRLEADLRASVPLGEALSDVLRDFVIFHGLVAAGCYLYAARRLRAWNSEPSAPRRLPPAADHPVLRERHIRQGKPWPALGDHPMLWKELYAEPGLGMRRFWQATGPVLWRLAPALLAGFLLSCCVLMSAAAGAGDRGQHLNALIRVLGTPVACFMLLGIGLRAAGALSGERERQTLDGLLTSPLENRTILAAKAVASLRCVSWGWWFLGPVWIFGPLLGVLNPLAPLLLFVAWAIFATLVAVLGLWFSLLSRTTLRATVLTLLAVLVVSAAPLAFWSFVETAVTLAGLRREYTWVAEYEAYPLTPPATLYLLAFHSSDFEPQGLLPAYMLKDMLLALVAYAALAAALWGLLLARFGPITGRMPYGKSGLGDASQKPS
jgi:ABC-type transport system involved in multi-copper enzyme maturation permease subunit